MRYNGVKGTFLFIHTQEKLLTMNMNIAIVMHMNIYISKANEEYLRGQGGSMSGIINFLLDTERLKNPAVANEKVHTGAQIHTATTAASNIAEKYAKFQELKEQFSEPVYTPID